ncbi:MAG: DUF1761 domain-containing protein [Candidatus Paceibacterota bacterium]|jgi:hypothetical protein
MYISFFLMVLAASIASTALGFIWYSQILFGKKWMELMGVTAGGPKPEGMAKTYGFSFLTTCVTAGVLALILGMFPPSFPLYAKLVTLLFIGFVGSFGASEYLFAFPKKSWGLYLINQGYNLASLILMAAVFVLFS